MRLLTVIPELEPFLATVRPFFSRNQFRHFARYVIGLIGAKRKTIKTIARSTLDSFDQSSLNRFINSEVWDTDVLAKASMKVLADDHGNCSGGVVFLIIDDTLLEKSGESMDSVGYLYSTKDEKSVLSHDLVSMLLVCSCGRVVPIDLRQYVKERVCKEEKREFRTRVELAREMIESLSLPHPSLSTKKVVVLFDSWYLCREIVDAVRKRGWHFVAETKSNRNVSLDRGSEISVSDSVVSLGEDDCDGVVTVREKTYAYRLVNGGKDTFMRSLHANGNVKIIAERELDGQDEIHYVVTDMLDVSPEDFISFFKRRHLTEEFYRDAKQNLGLGKYMVRGHEAINRHWWLVFIAYNALNHLRGGLAPLSRMTIGQLCDWVEERCETLKWTGTPISTPAT